MSARPPRYCERLLPPYSYVPGHAPHPVSDPQGHMHGESHEAVEPIDTNGWRESDEYLFGIDLFNYGFYWEAHEAWESLWHAASRTGPTADFLKGLIKLAAAAVKAREGNPRGVQRHAARAEELISGLPTHYCGLSIEGLISEAHKLANEADRYATPDPHRDVEIRLTPTAAE